MSVGQDLPRQPLPASPQPVEPRGGDASGARKLLVFIVVVLAVGAMHMASVVFVPLALATALTLLMWPLHRRMTRAVPAWLSVMALALLVIASMSIVIGGVVYAGRTTVSKLGDPGGGTADAYQSLRSRMKSSGLPVGWLPEEFSVPESQSSGSGSSSGSSFESTQSNPLTYTPRQGTSGDNANAQHSNAQQNENQGDSANQSETQNANQGDAKSRPTGLLQNVISFLLRGARGVLWNLLMVGLAVFLMVLLILEMPSIRARFKRALDDGRYNQLERIAEQSMQQFRLYLVEKTITGALAGVATGLLCWATSVPGALAWGILAFVFNYVPNIGVYLSAFPPVILGFVTGGVTTGLIVLAGLILIETLSANLLEPILQGGALVLSPFMALVSLVFWAWLWGPIGAVISVPLTATLLVILRNVAATKLAGRLLSDTES